MWLVPTKCRSSSEGFYSYQLHLTLINCLAAQVCIFIHRGNRPQNIKVSIAIKFKVHRLILKKTEDTSAFSICTMPGLQQVLNKYFVE